MAGRALAIGATTAGRVWRLRSEPWIAARIGLLINRFFGS
jgi:hypothetical protein